MRPGTARATCIGRDLNALASARVNMLMAGVGRRLETLAAAVAAPQRWLWPRQAGLRTAEPYQRFSSPPILS
jgi:hypothetical protein